MRKLIWMSLCLGFVSLLSACAFETTASTTTEPTTTTSSTEPTTMTATTVTTATTARTFQVIFDSTGGSAVDTIRLEPGARIPAPVEPTLAGHRFLGWFLDGSMTLPWNFDVDSVTSDTLLLAGWEILKYTIDFRNEHGGLIKSVRQYYGTKVEAPSIDERFAYVFAGWSLDADKDELVAIATMPAEDLSLYVRWHEDPLGLPIMTITLDANIWDVGREEYVDALISIGNTDSAFSVDKAQASFRGRGNGSWWNYDKKGYRIKFDEKISLFGEDASKHWVLVPGGHDFSLMRSNAAYTITNEVLDGIEYTTSVHLVEVFVNGVYHGVYSLFEQVRVEEGRIDIPSEYGELDTGYLLELDAYAEGVEGIDYFWVRGIRYAFSVKSPDPDEYGGEVTEQRFRSQVAYMQDYVQALVDAIFRGDFEVVSHLADVDSMVDMYIIHELFKNTDTGYSSFFLYKKPSDKMFFGPAWDFDFTAGISRGEGTHEGLYVADTIRWSSDYTSSEIFIALMGQDVFVDLVKARYREVHTEIGYVIERVFSEAEAYHASFARDAQRWPWLWNWEADQAYVRDWLILRNDWLYAWASD